MILFDRQFAKPSKSQPPSHEGVSVSKVGGFFVHKSRVGRPGQKSTSLLREAVMPVPLSSAQEAQAQQLARALAEAAHEDFLRMARTLVAQSDADLFGDTEFEIRDQALRLTARAYEQHLAQKKMATRAPQ
jgi:hypothetical protein